jgi:hypothetical protein
MLWTKELNFKCKSLGDTERNSNDGVEVEVEVEVEAEAEIEAEIEGEVKGEGR